MVSDNSKGSQEPQDEAGMAASGYYAEAAAHKAALKRNMSSFLTVGLLALVALIIVVALGLAWFVNSRQVQAEGMQVQADVNSNLVIAKSSGTESGGIRYASILATTSPFAVSFATDDDVDSLVAATHDWTTGVDTGLIYNTNPTKVSRQTGLKAGSTDLAFAKVPIHKDADTKCYYMDYTVYIASADKALTVSSLDATFDATFASDTETLVDYQNAASIDFYLGDASAENYVGTLNLAKVKNKADGTGTEANASLDILKNVETDGEYTIPLNTEGYITVTMRLYFDGALLKSEGQTYVCSDSLSISDLKDLTMSVSFAANEVETD